MLTQLVEWYFCKVQVVGSSPTRSSIQQHIPWIRICEFRYT